MPDTTIEVKKVTIANDGNPLIFVQEAKSNENVRTKETRSSIDNRPEASVHQNIDGQRADVDGNGANHDGISREVRSGNGRDVLLSERGKSSDSGNVLVKQGKAKEAKESAKTLTLKHTKNIYSLLKGAPRIVVGKDVIISSDMAIPLTGNALSEVKKVVDESNIEMSGSASFGRIGVANNDVVISGNPKVAEIVNKGRRANVYVFKVGDGYYVCEQKYLDAFNNGENTIKANKDKRNSWAVFDKNNNVVGAFLPVAKASITDAEYDKLQSVSEVLEANKAKKAAQKKAPFNATETRLLCSRPKLMTFDMGESSFLICMHRER